MVFVYASSLGRNFVIKFSVPVSSVIGVFLTALTIRLLCTNQIMGSTSQPLASIYTFPSLIFITLLGRVLIAILFVVSKIVSINDGAIKL